MTDTLSRSDIIRSRLEAAFAPTYLNVIDESDQHIGHAGHQGGGRHFAIEITAPVLASLSRVEAHRRVYAIFADMIPEKIHALKIKIM